MVVGNICWFTKSDTKRGAVENLMLGSPMPSWPSTLLPNEKT